jgi:hypothetical protein
MFRYRSLMFVVVAGLLAIGCGKRQVIQVPPRVDLHALGAIGIVEFSSEAKGNLSAFATQRFIESLQESQPGVIVLELGKVSELSGANTTGNINHDAIRAIGEKYDVDAVIVGDLVVEDVRPNIDITSIVKSMSVSADVDANITTRLFETGRGATMWTRSSRCTRTVGQIGMSGGQVKFDARDPKGAYGDLVDALVNDITHDFRYSYVRQ